jgi:hypothetical protein
MFKMGSHDPFGHLKYKLWPKERPEVKLTIWFSTTKSRELPHWKAFNEGYNFALDLISIEGLHTKLWAPKVVGIPEQNDIWVLVMWPCTKYIIRGKVVASPKSELWWVLWVHIYPWFIRAPKCSNYALTNLFSLCRSVWIIELLINFLSPIPKFQHTPLPPKCYEPRNAPQLLLLSLSSPLDSQLSPSRSLGVCQIMCGDNNNYIYWYIIKFRGFYYYSGWFNSKHVMNLFSF